MSSTQKREEPVRGVCSRFSCPVERPPTERELLESRERKMLLSEEWVLHYNSTVRNRLGPRLKYGQCIDEFILLSMPALASPAFDWKDQVIHGDCLTVLRQMPAECVDLCVTSPPYADSRKRTYGGIHPDKYVEWFLPIAQELRRVLKPEGTFILNIKEKTVEGERHTYVIEAILGMRKQGWFWTEEFIWHKKSCHPGKWPNRFRDAWERCLQFNKQRKFAMYQDNVMVPMGDWAKTRLRNLSETDKRRDNSRVNSGFGKNVSNWLDRKMAYPSNVLHMASETGNKNHSAAFPISLPHWFIRLFSKEGDLVMDPFLGSGSTAVAAKLLGRHYLGIERVGEYVQLAQKALQTPPRQLKLREIDG